MKDKILKNIFIFIIISLILIPIVLGVYCMITGTTDTWSGNPNTSIESFWVGAILIYLFYCWPYIIIALLYTLIYSICYRKTELIKKFWEIIGIIVLIVFIISPLFIIIN